MRKGYLLPFGLIALGGLALAALCSCCLWAGEEEPRFDHKFDAGSGRTICVWSTRRGNLFDFKPGPNPLMIYYSIEVNGKVIAPKSWMEFDDGEEFRFELLVADGGRLACVYDANRSFENCYLVVLYDTESKESWVRDANGWYRDLAVKKKGRERFERVAHEYPSFKVPRALTE